MSSMMLLTNVAAERDRRPDTSSRHRSGNSRRGSSPAGYPAGHRLHLARRRWDRLSVRCAVMGDMDSGSAATLSYPITQRTLDNGLRVIASPDHVAPSVAVNLWYDVGSRHE
jgi:hypothetical protein